MDKYNIFGDLYKMKSDFLKKAITTAMIAVCAVSFAACSNAGGEEASVSGVSSVATVKATATPKAYTFPKEVPTENLISADLHLRTQFLRLKITARNSSIR